MAFARRVLKIGIMANKFCAGLIGVLYHLLVVFLKSGKAQSSDTQSRTDYHYMIEGE
jgi:hypothetical protein